MIHYNLFSKPWCYDNVQYADEFWKYAKDSGFYNEFIEEEKKHKKNLKYILKCILNFILPRNSKRWVFIKKWFRIRGGVSIKL